jgi:putative ABC transport system permease protein
VNGNLKRLFQDIRIALRGFRRQPGFAITILVILGLTTGMAVAIFTAFDAILIRKLPVVDQDRIAVMWPFRVRGAELAPPVSDLRAIARTVHASRSVAGVAHWGVSISPFVDGDRTVQLKQSLATANYFDIVGARPVAGRFFSAGEAAGASHEMVLSYRAWVSQFGGDRSVVGRRVSDPWSREPYTIVGVAPPGFSYPVGAECWTSLTQADTSVRVLAVARLAPGESIDAARDEYFSVVSRLEPTWKLTGASAESFTVAALGDIRPILVALASAVGLLLLMACVNVGNLFLVRTGTRARELSIRRAIGASSSDLVRQLVIESSILAAGGGVLGAAAAGIFLRGLALLAPPEFPRLDELQLHANELGVAIAVTAATALLFGVIPAFIGSRVNPASTLRHDARSGGETGRRRRVRDTLVVVQMAVALMMLVAAGLLSRSFANLVRLDLGYHTDQLSIMSVAYDPKSFAPSDSSRSGRIEASLAVDEQFEARVLAIPGVTALTPIMTPPFLGAGINVGLFEAEGQDIAQVAANPTIPWEVAGPLYFRTFGIAVSRGRGFLPSDRDGSMPVAIVSDAVARLLWPGQNAMGKRLRFAPSAQKAGDPLPKMYSEWRTIVGIVSDTHFRQLKESSPTVYVPWRQVPGVVWGTFAVRSTGSARATVAGIRAALGQLTHSYTLWSWESMDDILAAPLAEPRLSALLVAAFGVVALMLAGLGLYGVMSTAVREQTREIGIRIALGATPHAIRTAVVRRAFKLSAVGSAFGFVLSLAGTRFLRSLLFEVSASDPATLVAGSVVLLMVGVGAAYVPAGRATRIDPLEALRSD